ncbi:efflux RND transporter permease subunit [Paraburkholderia sp. CNPSo 3272]|uniref:efflux RND transporter permease subunit n=1 Tax=Paraburkholderia sp. CNPSo 3272 TaxID=2940931 RepID=UPI0020B6D16B|nr:efflux RND transporter permease subunit [Paraburkholderia sp. CNPSo 3272]MCP3727108.1 efflux RND transporter permease subunit [Paraburkholderia sp. CNPSo 3272]
MISRFVVRLEHFFFGHRGVVVLAIAVFTAIMAVFAVQLRMEAGFEKQMPIGHEYIQTFQKYRKDLFGANRITVVVRSRKGSIWTPAGLTRLYKVTQAVTFLPGVDRQGVMSLWTPNAFVNEITEDGFRANPVIDGTITPNQLTPAVVDKIRKSAINGGYIGTLVSHSEDSAMITAELNERDGSGKTLDYVQLNHLLDDQVRKPFEDSGYEIQIIGFAKQIGDIADGAKAVLGFCSIALLLTALAVYWYCHSVRFTVLPIMCSLTSLVWQFGTLRLLGFGLDPLAVLVPFLVFAIGVSHGIQQVNFIVRELSHGSNTIEAARRSFSGLLVPGTLALVTALVSFVTLLLIPIPMVRELAITASLGVGYKIITNLVMLPVAASFFNFSKAYADDALERRERRSRWLRSLARVAEPRNAYAVVCITAVVFALAVWQSRDRVIGTLQPGAPELRADSRFNLDAVSIANNYDVGLDWLTVVFESSGAACDNPVVGIYEDDFASTMKHEPGVVSVESYPAMLRDYNEGYNEGNPKMNVVPIDPGNYGGLSAEIGRLKGYMSKDCSMTAVHLFLTDHKATTLTRVLDDVKQYRELHQVNGITIRLAAGNAGVIAATNDEVAKSELPMMLYVYAAILILVFLAYRDFRAMVACCAPLTVATFIGYWFMKELQIGLTVATLPVMVLAVGIGVDYAFYIYNRLQLHMANGQPIVKAVEHAMLEVGVATIFTAITLAIGVATWSFSALKFQADMGKLLAFMFIVNLVMAMTALPALAVVLEKLFPRRSPVRAPGLLSH